MKVLIIEPRVNFEIENKSDNMMKCLNQIEKKGHFAYCSTKGILNSDADIDVILLSDDAIPFRSFLIMFQRKKLREFAKFFGFVTNKKEDVPDNLFIINPSDVKNQDGIDWAKAFDYINI
jgi:hypothetical protein